jgi:O6-methylguanine-DNA--protein-cysteine methyltransferase
VLSVLNANPIPLVIPCHRIVTNKSGVGGYVAGTRQEAVAPRLEEQVAARG